MRLIAFFQNTPNFMQNLETQWKLQKRYFVFGKIVFEFVTGNFMTRVLVFGSQCVKNSPKLSELTKSNFFQLNLSKFDGIIR